MKNLDWKLLSSEYLFRDLWFTVRKDTCERPDGVIVTPYYVYEFPTWISAVALTRNREIVIVRQYRHGIRQTIIEIPGGCVDETDASLESAVARELLEETGYIFDDYIPLGKISPNPSTNTNWMHMFLAMGGQLKQDQALDHNEDIEVLLYSVDEIKSMLRENRIVQSLHVTALFYAFEKLNELNY
ncbi:MAG TPA: NUDIX hydrolase [Flavitalea sp.]|nr:NUDIX hydrolase [Flavitalea sp.]